MESAKPEIVGLLNEGAGRLLARASDSRSLSFESLVPRINAAVQKYLLKDAPSTQHHAEQRPTLLVFDAASSNPTPERRTTPPKANHFH